MKRILLVLILFLFANSANAVVYQYNSKGYKTGSIKKTSTGYNTYDAKGYKTGNYKVQGKKVVQYDKKGYKVSTFYLPDRK